MLGAKAKYEKVTVKAWVVERCIELLDDGNVELARECLRRVSDPEYRKRDRECKERLYWNLRNSSNDAEFAENKRLYDEYMEQSLL